MPPLTDNDIGPLLESLGYEYVSGWGPNAIWRTPKAWGDQASIRQANAANDEFGNESPYAAASGKAPSGFQGPGGVQYVYDPNDPTRATPVQGVQYPEAEGRYFSSGGQQYYIDPSDPTRAIPVGGVVTSEGGMTAAQSAAYGLDQARFNEDQRQFDITSAAQTARDAETARANAADYNLKYQTYMQNAEAAARAAAQYNTTLDFEKNKQAFAENIGNKQLALQAQTAIATQQYQQQTLQMQAQQLRQQADQFKAQMQFEIMQANQQFETSKQDRLANIATQAGVLAQNPGDIGKLAATTLANSGWGGANKAAANQNYITAESTTPLESLLRTRQEVANQQSPYANLLNPQAAAQQGVSFGTEGYSPDQLAMMDKQIAQQTNDVLGSILSGNQHSSTTSPNDALAQALNAAGILTANQRIANTAAAPVTAVKNEGGVFSRAAGGGFLSSAMRKVGERGPELEIDLADGTTLILNAGQQQALKKAGLDVEAAGKQGGGVTPYQAGGIFGGFDNVQDTDRTLANDFLQQAFARARANTPFAQGPLPSPVYLSSPGTNPFVAQLLGSLKALGEGIPAEQTAYLANLYRPMGAQEHVVGRSR